MSMDLENFEEHLHDILRREDAPAGFAERVLARVSELDAGTRAFPYRKNFELRSTGPVENRPAGWQPAPQGTRRIAVSRPEAWFRRPFALALAATIAAVAIVPAVVFDYQRREARGLKAEQDLMMALAITRTQLQMARAKAQHRQGTTQ